MCELLFSHLLTFFFFYFFSCLSFRSHLNSLFELIDKEIDVLINENANRK